MRDSTFLQKGQLMADAKDRYSGASDEYVHKTVPSSAADQERYARSKARESEFGENWAKNPVDLNEICERFAPGAIGQKKGYKFHFIGERYTIIADMISGYLRIFDRTIKQFVKLDGTTGTKEETHFKILRREDM